ncbi:hypothetical protein QR77_28710 [Streptomyces sp. 150FB]|uniref:DUF6114 domain-containing protein n=1 Tax=Streptomyces sp. 150FB TaxID=1576605 RepID=UPI0005890378|nr:DUF6114 domain-containing protein [Streptomyces sp. 150FB]KIF76774.1 hypothetical protein QR77_28710 [Streptomyces sp. 150FB]
MSAESSDRQGRFTYWRLRFRGWRGTRPFWAGLFTLVSGVPIAYFPYANLTLGNLTLAMGTPAGASSLIIGVLLVTLGLTMWFHSIVRVFAGVATILLAMISLPLSNFGGFIIGFVLALVGGGLSIAWAPGKPRTETEQYDDTPRGAPEPDSSDDPYFPASYGPGSYGSDAYDRGPRAGEGLNVTDTTAHANGGRNSAG